MYGHGGLSVLTLGEEGTVVLRVTAAELDRPGLRIVTGDPGTGRLAQLSSVPLDGAAVSFAEDYLRATS